MRVYDGRGDRRVFPTKRTVTVVSAGRQVCGGNDHMVLRKQGRVDWSLFYCDTGRLYVGEHILEPGQIWLYPPEIPQQYTMYSRDETAYWFLHFTGSDVAAMMESLGITTCSVIEVTSTSVADIFRQIQRSLEGDSALSVLEAEYHALHLLSKIAKERSGVSGMHMMKRVTDNMEHSFAGEYDAAQYARMLNISVSRFNHLFKECVGVAPYAYYVNLRMANACGLLEDTNLKIKDIAQLCGYEDALYFAQVFKKAVGVTPSAYRKMNRNWKQ